MPRDVAREVAAALPAAKRHEALTRFARCRDWNGA
jgi:hypothetical protein